jgi:hypothetical protein
MKRDERWEDTMATEAQRRASRRNIRKATTAAKKSRTIAKLPKKTRTALARRANEVKQQRGRSSGVGTPGNAFAGGEAEGSGDATGA